MGNTVSSPSGQESPLYDRRTFPRTEREKKLLPKCNTIGRSDITNQNEGNGNQENSRMLFLMYLINKTWNVVGGKRWVNLRSCNFRAKTENENGKDSESDFRKSFVVKFWNFSAMTI